MQACERRARERERKMEEEDDEREKLVFIAKLAEQAERYDDMVESMKKIAKMDIEPTGEERNLLSISYKNIICPRRVSWRIISSLEEKEKAEGPEKNLRRFEAYKKQVEDEITKISNEILSIVAIHLLPNSTSGESIVFFCKMQGDYYRYLAEFKEGNEKKDDVNQALKAYQAATSTAMSELAPAHPIRLGLALNFSVFYYEILELPRRAWNMAKQAFDEAIRELNSISEEMYEDSALIMKLLKDNLTLWTSDLPPPQGGEQTNEINMN